MYIVGRTMHIITGSRALVIQNVGPIRSIIIRSGYMREMSVRAL
jgi:hypothetical protein